MEHKVSELIPATLESIRQPPITAKPQSVDRNWASKWLQLRTSPHPKLEGLEREVFAFCKGVWNSPLRGYLLVLAASNGSGKTHCAKAVFRWARAVGHGLQFVRKKNVIGFLQSDFWPWPEFLDTLKNGGWGIVEDAAQTDLLILDDLGAGHDPSSVGTDKLCQILSKRLDKWTLITTNIMPDAWATIFDQRIASRFFRSSRIVDLTGVPDYGVTHGPA